MKKIKSGIYGLNPLLAGGFTENSTTVVIGCSGAGKTTFATQFIRRGIEDDQECIFVSLDENKDQIIKEAIAMGWDNITDAIRDRKLVFIDASGKDFASFIREELPSFVEDWQGANTRIAIDPLTPVIWAVDDLYEQRDLLGYMLKETRKIGTVLCTLEEHGSHGDLSGREVVIPMYLADCVIHLRYRPMLVHDNTFVQQPSRTLKILKCRGCKHSELPHPFRIIRGFGIVVKPMDEHIREPTKNLDTLRKSIADIRKHIPFKIYERLEKTVSSLNDHSLGDVNPQELLNTILGDYMERDKIDEITKLISRNNK